MALEKNRLRLGIVPLSDCAPIVAAKELGFFADNGLDVEISREPSWANIRDKVLAGPWTLDQATRPIPMGPDRFFDGSRFDPAAAESLAAHYARTPLIPARTA